MSQYLPAIIGRTTPGGILYVIFDYNGSRYVNKYSDISDGSLISSSTIAIGNQVIINRSEFNDYRSMDYCLVGGGGGGGYGISGGGGGGGASAIVGTPKRSILDKNNIKNDLSNNYTIYGYFPNISGGTQQTHTISFSTNSFILTIGVGGNGGTNSTDASNGQNSIIVRNIGVENRIVLVNGGSRGINAGGSGSGGNGGSSGGTGGSGGSSLYLDYINGGDGSNGGGGGGGGSIISENIGGIGGNGGTYGGTGQNNNGIYGGGGGGGSLNDLPGIYYKMGGNGGGNGGFFGGGGGGGNGGPSGQNGGKGGSGYAILHFYN